MRTVPPILACLLATGLVAACEREQPQPVLVSPAPAPVQAQDPIIVTEDGRPVDPDTARSIAETLRQLQGGEPEAVPEQTQAQARDASALHGRWRVRHTIYRTNGEGGAPQPPLAPVTWEFAPDGAFMVRGGNSIDARYLYTGDRIVVSGFGPVQDYRVDRLDDNELHVTSVIEAGSLRLENTTVLDRAP